MSPDPSSPPPVRIRLEPLAVELEVARGGSLVAALAARGVEFPCGGVGECGGCGVRILSGSLPITEADRSIFTAQELATGWRLACQARPESPLVLECAQWHMEILTDDEAGCPILPAPFAGRVGRPTTSQSGLAIAIDLGTTTIAAQLIDANTGDVLGVETMLNPQAAFGSDVMSRIRATLEGSDLTSPIRIALGQLVARLAAGRDSQITEVLLVGNTVMHHLFCALSVEPLSHVPFQSPHLAEQRFTPCDLAWNLPADCVVRFARCIGGFVGSDILAGIVATGIARRADLTALVDLGTNGEVAIGNRDGIVCASTAAGPAFEAGAIRMGMRAVTGAIAYVALEGVVDRDKGTGFSPHTILKGTGFSPYTIAEESIRALAPEGKPRPLNQLANSTLHVTVIGDAEPRGICGSGLVDAIAAGLRSGAILPSGRVANGTKLFPLVSNVVPPVVLYQSDIRELQLAKAAIAAGFRLLLKHLASTGEKRTGGEECTGGEEDTDEEGTGEKRTGGEECTGGEEGTGEEGTGEKRTGGEECTGGEEGTEGEEGPGGEEGTEGEEGTGEECTGEEKGTGFSPYIEQSEKPEGALAPEGTPPLHAIHLAGAFGNYIQIDSAIRIGLLEFPHNAIHAAGNTALRGAKMLLLADREPTLPPIQHFSLAADPAFQDEFANCMTFPESL